MAKGQLNPLWLRLLVIVMFGVSCAAWVSGVMTGELRNIEAIAALTLPFGAYWVMRMFGGRIER